MDSEKKDAFVKIRGLEKSFGSQKVLRGVDLDIYKGETLVLLGGSVSYTHLTLPTIYSV